MGCQTGAIRSGRRSGHFGVAPGSEGCGSYRKFLLAKNVTIICGEWERDWEIFLDACTKIGDLRLTHKGPGSQTDADEVLRSTVGANGLLIVQPLGLADIQRKLTPFCLGLSLNSFAISLCSLTVVFCGLFIAGAVEHHPLWLCRLRS
jgi:hypothetical protein